VLVTDPHLAVAVVAALASVAWGPRLQADPAALDARDWDVCVAAAGFAGAALEARRGRGLLLLAAAPAHRRRPR
jgi:hypothetical protein